MISYVDSKLKLSATFLVAGLILSGCGASGGNSAGSDSSLKTNKTNDSVNKQVYTAELGLTPRQRFSKALQKLENGEDGQALAELNAYLVAVPRSNSARNLIAQISTDSSQYFPAEHFKVNLTSGVSLSTLANKYLGSALKFYALAKYNNIKNPSRVNIGQEIKIPLTQLARSKRDKDNSAALEVPGKEHKKSVDDLVKMAEDSDIAQNTVDAIGSVSAANAVDEVMETAPSVEPVAVTEAVVEVIPTAESTLIEMQALAQNANYAGAIEKITTLETFGKLNKTSRELATNVYVERAKEISETDNILAATYYTKAGKLNLLAEQSFAAFENFKTAMNLDEQNAQAMEHMLVLQKEIADKYHREASSAFRRQELDTAIEKWDMVLKVDPDHSSAKLYRAQAIELKEKLDKINRN